MSLQDLAKKLRRIAEEGQRSAAVNESGFDRGIIVAIDRSELTQILDALDDSRVSDEVLWSDYAAATLAGHSDVVYQPDAGGEVGFVSLAARTADIMIRLHRERFPRTR